MSALVDKIRLRILDRPSLNKVLPGQTFSDALIEACIEGATEDFNINEVSPKLNYTSTQIPFEILLSGVCAKLVEAEKHNAKRNSIGHSEGGTSFDFYGSKDRALTELLNLYELDFKKRVRMFKARINANNFMGPVQT